MIAQEVIREIEREQLRDDITEFHVGDTVRVQAYSGFRRDGAEASGRKQPRDIHGSEVFKRSRRGKDLAGSQPECGEDRSGSSRKGAPCEIVLPS